MSRVDEPRSNPVWIFLGGALGAVFGAIVGVPTGFFLGAQVGGGGGPHDGSTGIVYLFFGVLLGGASASSAGARAARSLVRCSQGAFGSGQELAAAPGAER